MNETAHRRLRGFRLLRQGDDRRIHPESRSVHTSDKGTLRRQIGHRNT